MVGVSVTATYDEDMNKFRCWYMTSGSADDLSEYNVAYAESTNGLQWSKPLVGTANVPPYENHNLVVNYSHGLCVFKDPDDPDPNRRYKGLGGSLVGFSPDGIHWTTQPFNAAGKNDTSSSVIRWNGQYMAFIRNQGTPWDNGVMREVAISTSTDFVNWTPKQTIFRTDTEDGNPWTQPYSLGVTPYGNQLVGMLWMLHLDKEEGNNTFGDMDVQLMTSRDGRDWQRVANRGTFLEPAPGTWDEGRTNTSTTMFVKDDKVWIYYTGMDTRHGESFMSTASGIGLATLPADRFVAVTADQPGQQGILETKQFTFEGRELILNAELPSDESLQVEVLGSDGNVLAGYDRTHCRLTRHDALRWEVNWIDGQQNMSLGTVGEPSIALRFVVSDGELYAFQVVPEPGVWAMLTGAAAVGWFCRRRGLRRLFFRA
jgi:hypothetical protein